MKRRRGSVFYLRPFPFTLIFIFFLSCQSNDMYLVREIRSILGHCQDCLIFSPSCWKRALVNESAHDGRKKRLLLTEERERERLAVHPAQSKLAKAE